MLSVFIESLNITISNREEFQLFIDSLYLFQYHVVDFHTDVRPEEIPEKNYEHQKEAIPDTFHISSQHQNKPYADDYSISLVQPVIHFDVTVTQFLVSTAPDSQTNSTDYHRR